MAASKPSWVGKSPADMTDEELKQAKQAVADDLAPAQDRLNMLSAAVSQLDYEINTRFRMASGMVPPNTLTPYPAEALSEAYGG